MATANRSESDYSKKLSWYLSHARHSVWDCFGADQQRKMIDDDLAAGRSVSIVLFSVITAGLLMSAISLFVILATM